MSKCLREAGARSSKCSPEVDVRIINLNASLTLSSYLIIQRLITITIIIYESLTDS